MTEPLLAPGLRASWLNGWLAAIGVTVLVDDARLAWTNDVVPIAELTVPGTASASATIAAALPSAAQLSSLAIAPYAYHLSEEDYRAAAELSRYGKDFSLAASVTDLAREDGTKLAHSRFDPGAPHGETLWRRLKRCREELGDGEGLERLVALSLAGKGERRKVDGLGFDFTRIRAAGNPADMRVDPVVECLAFFGLAFLPLRGDGGRPRPRGWRARRFAWPTWSAPLDRWAIDALLGILFREDVTRWPKLPIGVGQAFESVEYEWFKPEVTRGYGARRVV